MSCVDGHWTSAACPDIECPPIECPADTGSVLGRSCPIEGAQCGDPCCSSAIECDGGVWVPGPEADCVLCDEYPCGDGACGADQFCRATCGPAGGTMHSCVTLPPGCTSCDCIPLGGVFECEMIDGHPHVGEVALCF
jgi:hypothetical protein